MPGIEMPSIVLSDLSIAEVAKDKIIRQNGPAPVLLFPRLLSS